MFIHLTFVIRFIHVYPIVLPCLYMKWPWKMMWNHSSWSHIIHSNGSYSFTWLWTFEHDCAWLWNIIYTVNVNFESHAWVRVEKQWSWPCPCGWHFCIRLYRSDGKIWYRYVCLSVCQFVSIYFYVRLFNDGFTLQILKAPSDELRDERTCTQIEGYRFFQTMLGNSFIILYE